MPNPLDRFRLDGQVALITGGARGIGRATAEAFVAAGARAVLLDRDLPEAESAANAIGNAEAHALDVTDEAEVNRLFDAVATRHGRLDILVNNAGASIRKPTTELSKAEWDTVIAVNQSAVFLCARAAARHMLEATRRRDRQSRVDHGIFRRRALPEHLLPGEQGRGGEHDARARDRMGEGQYPRQRGGAGLGAHRIYRAGAGEAGVGQRDRSLTPMGRLVEPEEVAAAILFLASPAASMITGHAIAVDGGYLAQ